MQRFRPTIFSYWSNLGTVAPLMLQSATEAGWNGYREKLEELRSESEKLGFRSVPVQVDKIFVQIGRSGIPPVLGLAQSQLFVDLAARIKEELEYPLLFMIPVEKKWFCEKPTVGWEDVISRYPSPALFNDICEAGRCLATDRLTGCVFHLMRIVETAVIELLWLTGKEDYKAHFGSVVSKLDHLANKVKFEDLSLQARPHIGFVRDILPQLHAVKDSWRNRVSHVETRIIPTEGYTEESVMEIYIATRGLMRKLAKDAPLKPATK